MSKLKTMLNGIIKENPVLVLLLGTCPSLATTTMAVNGLGMGLAATFVLIGSNFVISLLRNVIPGKVRIPAYIIIIAGFVTIIGQLIKAYVPALDSALGIFIPLIVVNCIILARAEMYASKNRPLDSVMDGLGMGLGFTLALVLIGSVREILGSGTWFGITLTKELWSPVSFFTMPAGGFLVFGCMIALFNKITHREKPAKSGCAACPSKGMCGSCGDEGEEEAK